MSVDTYRGEERLAFALDVGTTMSAVSFAHLEPGEEPRIRLVTRWPGQEEAAGDCKVPTVVRYSQEGSAVQFGTEAVENLRGLENTCVARWFKLHLHPAVMRTRNHLTPPPLPPRVSIKTVYADFLAYIFRHAREFVDNSTLDAIGRGSLWNRLKDNFVVILAIPNGWDGAQQAFLREAVVSAGILPFSHSHERLQFVSESEASIHFALSHANIGNWLREGTTLAVCDAGGSTVDTTVYKCISAVPKLELEEVTSSECVQAGGALVDQEAERFLQNKLLGSRYGSREVIAAMVNEFERKTKRKFNGDTDISVIHFGQTYDTERPFVTAGRVTLNCNEVKSIFERPVKEIASSVADIMKRAGGVEAMLLVGGFAESRYLREVLQDAVQSRGVRMLNIDEATKAAAEGALAWFTKQVVVARAARATYGISVCRQYNRNSPGHLERARLNCTFSSGEGVTKLNGFFDPLVRKNDVVHHDKSIRSSFCRTYTKVPSQLAHHEEELICVDNAQPEVWCKNPDGSIADGFRSVCKLKADLSGMQRSLGTYTTWKGKPYWRIDFDIEIFFGQTSLCANLAWKEDGQVRKGPVSVVPNSVT